MAVFACGVLLAASHELCAQDAAQWDDAAKRVERLSPDRFQRVPPAVRQQMLADTCRVPQFGTPRSTDLVRGNSVRGVEPAPPLTNVISGEFAARGQRDWAALCSSDGHSVIRVYWGGPITCSPSFKPVPDVELLEDYAFSASIATATIPRMRRMARSSYEPFKLPSLAHDGLTLTRKFSTLYYCDRGKWLEFDVVIS